MEVAVFFETILPTYQPGRRHLQENLIWTFTAPSSTNFSRNFSWRNLFQLNVHRLCWILLGGVHLSSRTRRNTERGRRKRRRKRGIKKALSLKVPRQRPFVLLVKVGWRDCKALGAWIGETMERGHCYEQSDKLRKFFTSLDRNSDINVVHWNSDLKFGLH